MKAHARRVIPAEILEERGDHNTKPVVPVPVVWVVPVADSTTRIVGLIVEGTTTKSSSLSLASSKALVSIRADAYSTNALLRMRNLFPAAEQAPDLGNHFSDVLILPCGQPFPAGGEAQVQAHVVEVFIGKGDALQPLFARAVIRRLDVFAQVERGIQQPFGDRVPLRLWKIIRHRQQPGDEIEGAREQRHF
jgi:hypothetical protein